MNLGLLRGDGLGARAFRGSALTLLGFGGTNVLRLASNLLLTRLLFPEAFGLMAIVQVVLGGLAMMSDLGVHSAIVQDRRAAEPAFLNTAFTIQILRGLCLWLLTLVLAAPMADFYEAPMLAQLLPVAGLTVLIEGFVSMRFALASRNLVLGRVTIMGLGTQAAGIVVTTVLAAALQSVWALVVGAIFSALLKVALSHMVLPGPQDRIRFDRESAFRLIGFGKWIFLATIAGFAVNQGDRAILGKFVPLGDLAIYNIGYFLGAMPLLLGRGLMARIVFPLYARLPPSESAENRRKINRARRWLSALLIAALAVLALIGVPLVTLLYDPRYEAAGPVLVLVAISCTPMIVTAGYYNLPLAAGDSGRFAVLITGLALLQSTAMLIGASRFGIGGVAVAPGIAAILFWPVLVWLIRPYKGWDPVQDLVLGLSGAVLVTVLALLRWEVLVPLFQAG